ncbi:signal peptidase I [uncultured Clostridium sp.]|uniref:signal peptidase I n=1 Tax=uncultured Clostridium sp. TaxID=59620 RepID=UPI0025E6F22B|nr:signal peptidase I [uncultured Clostridium sp.]
MNEIKEKEIIQDSKQENRKSKRSFLRECIIYISIVAVIAILVWRFIGYGVWITSGSMIPALEVKDRLIVSKVYNTDNLEYGDIILFKNDKYKDKTLIKRLIGKPGDKIEIINGTVFRNGQQLQEDYVKNNEKYNGTFEVPEDKFFFLGDNRAESDDSRYWDDPYVSKDDIDAKAQIKYYPIKDFGFVK